MLHRSLFVSFLQCGMAKHQAAGSLVDTRPEKKIRTVHGDDEDVDDFDFSKASKEFHQRYINNSSPDGHESFDDELVPFANPSASAPVAVVGTSIVLDAKVHAPSETASTAVATLPPPPETDGTGVPIHTHASSNGSAASGNFGRVTATNLVGDPEQERALAAMKAGKSIFLTGPAGVGKSTVFTRFDKEYVIPNKKVFHKTALTGIAAERIGGMTIHKYLGIQIVDQPIDFYLEKATKDLAAFRKLVTKMKDAQEEVAKLKAFADFVITGKPLPTATASASSSAASTIGDKVVKLKSQFAPSHVAQFGTAFLTKEQKLENELKANPYYRAHMEFLDAKRLVETHPVYRVRHADGIMVDEISLMLNHVLIVVKNVIDILREGKPPLQYIFGGDLFQGSPVNPCPNDDDPPHRILHWELNQKFILDTAIWKEMGVQTFELSTVHRQSDPEQVRLLMCIRAGYMPDKYLKMLTDRSASGTEIVKGYTPVPTLPNGDAAIWLMGNRKIVSMKNEEALRNLAGDPFVFNTEIFFVFVERDAHRNPSTYWYRRIWSGGNYNFEFVNDFKASSASATSTTSVSKKNDSAAAAPPKATSNVALPRSFRHRMVRILNQKLANSMSETVLKLKPRSNVLFTRSVLAKVPINNGTQASVITQTGMEAKHKYEDPFYDQKRDTEYIRMHEAPLPVPKESITVNCKGEQIEIVPVDTEVAIEEGDEFRDKNEWTRYCIIRQFPVIPAAAITADRSISLEVDAEVVDCETIDSRDNNGLFYIAISRVRNMNNALLKDFRPSVIKANPRAIIHGRKSIPFFRDMKDEEFNAMMKLGTKTSRDGTVSFYYEPDRHTERHGK